MPPIKKKNKKTEPVYVSKDGITMAWFFLTVGALLYTAWYVKDISGAIHPARKYVIMSRSDQRRSPDVMSEADLLQRMQEEVHVVVDSVFNRSPTGLDRQEAGRRFFTPEAWTAISAEIETEKAMFSENHIHQKAEIGGVSIVDIERPAKVQPPAKAQDMANAPPPAPGQSQGPPDRRVTTTGQLIRVGTVGKKGTNLQKLFHEVWEFQIVLEFEPNGRLNANGVYPWTCRDLQMTRRLSSSDRPLPKENS